MLVVEWDLDGWIWRSYTAIDACRWVDGEPTVGHDLSMQQ